MEYETEEIQQHLRREDRRDLSRVIGRSDLDQVDADDLVSQATQAPMQTAGSAPAGHRVLADSALADVFGLELAGTVNGVSKMVETTAKPAPRKRATANKAAKKTTAKAATPATAKAPAQNVAKKAAKKTSAAKPRSSGNT